MSGVLALTAALCWGASTVCAAIAVERGPVIAVTLWSQLSGLACGLPLLLGVPLTRLSPADALAGAAGGLGTGLSLALLYASTRRLQPGLASALSNTTAAGIPVGVTFALGTAVTGQVVVGAALCVAAILLATRAPAQSEGGALLAAAGRSHAAVRGMRTGLAIAVASGGAMSVYYLAIASVEPSLGVWAALEARAASCVALWLCGMAISRRGTRLSRRQLAPTLGCGVLGMAGALAYSFAVTRGSVITVVPLVALSPLVTAIASWWLLKQRLSPVQLAGLVVAVAGSVLISTSGG